MLTIDPAELAALEARAGVVSRTLIWIVAKERDTGNPVTMGLWSGQDARVFSIGGENRTYRGPALLELPQIEGGVGLEVRYLDIPIPPMTDEARAILRQYDPRLARVEIHQANFSIETNNLLAEPRRLFKGRLNESPINTAEMGGGSSAVLKVASAARSLTRALFKYFSDADQRARNPDDAFLQHVSTTGLKQVFWGEEEVGRRRGGGSARRSGEGGGWDAEDNGGGDTWG